MKTSPRTLPDPGTLPAERYGAFLVVRRGLPLLVAAGAWLAALFHVAGRGWWMLLVVAGAAAAWPTFYRGAAYLRNRASIMRWDGLCVRSLRPLAKRLGREEAWILSFCAWHNHRVREAFATRKARRVLVLLPHCIQWSRCAAAILDDLQHCYDCGKCVVGDFMLAALAGRWNSRITNRSHKAYREAREQRPELLVAVSCTDRLLKGLVKLPETPTYVIPLALPHGMCVDTDFSIAHLRAAMEALVQPPPELSRIQPLVREA